MGRVTTIKGKQIDLAALREVHGATVALGNARMNARGDKLGRGGAIVKTKQQVVKDYYDNNPKAVTVSTVSLKDLSGEVMTPAEAVAKLTQEKIVSKRKIKDSDD